MEKKFRFALPTTILSLALSLMCFYSYLTFEREPLIPLKGNFLKLERVSSDYHLFLENYPNLKFELMSIMVKNFKLGLFEREIKKGTPISLLISKEDFLNPRNGVLESRKNQISIYEIEGPMNVYLSKDDSFSSMYFNNQIMSPTLGVIFLFISLYCLKQYFNNRKNFKYLNL